MCKCNPLIKTPWCDQGDCVGSFEIDDITNLLLNMSAGLHPKHLQKDEVELLKTKYGEDWLNELGYTEEWLANNPE